MKALVVGYGSIGTRHARILKELGCSTAVVSSRRIDFNPCYGTLDQALREERPDYVVVANRTGEHYETVLVLARLGFRGQLLVEKPVFAQALDFPKHSFANVAIGYNLRFHPLLRRLKGLLENEKVLSVQAYVGKYLPEWREKADYRQGYSAIKSSGGGVLRDLSHELDYLNWMFGPWERVAALGGHFSGLEIDSEDIFCILMVTKKCPVISVQMNYVDRAAKREIVVITDAHSFRADLISGFLETDGKRESWKAEGDSTYRFQHEAILNREQSAYCSLAQGMEIMRLIEAVERASRQKVWVGR